MPPEPPTRDEIWRGALRRDPERRGFDDHQPRMGHPWRTGVTPGKQEGLAAVFLRALSDLAGFGAVWHWDFDRPQCREEFEHLVGEICDGADALRDVAEDVREQR